MMLVLGILVVVLWVCISPNWQTQHNRKSDHRKAHALESLGAGEAEHMRTQPEAQTIGRPGDQCQPEHLLCHQSTRQIAEGGEQSCAQKEDDGRGPHISPLAIATQQIGYDWRPANLRNAAEQARKCTRDNGRAVMGLGFITPTRNQQYQHGNSQSGNDPPQRERIGKAQHISAHRHAYDRAYKQQPDFLTVHTLPSLGDERQSRYAINNHQ